MDNPREQTFASYGEYRAALCDVLENARQTVIVFDPDLRECGLESPQGIAQLERLCSQSTRRDALRILLHSTTWLERNCPRLTRLLGHYAHCASVRTTDAEGHIWTQPFLVADDRHLVTRFHQDLPRGKRSGDGGGALTHFATQFETFWMNGDASAVGAQLGL